MRQTGSIGEGYKEIQFLGKGSFAQVFKVKKGNQFYAMKKISQYRLNDSHFKDNVYRQIAIIKQINHPRIIQFIQVVQTEQHLNIILEYAPGGSLYDQLKKQGKIPQQQVKSYVMDVIQALEFLHNRPSPILHRDLKPQNLLLDESGRCKLADFGSSNIILNGLARYSYEGTQEYMAPEITNNLPQRQGIDLWSIGILIYELLTGHTPKQNIEFPLYMSRCLQDLIKKLLHRDPTHRITLNDLKHHIWLTDYQPIVKITCPSKYHRKDLMIENVKKRKIQIYQQFNQKKRIKQNFQTKIYEGNQKNSKEISSIVNKHIINLNKKASLKYTIALNEEIIKKKRLLNQQKKLQQSIIEERLRIKCNQYYQNIQLMKKCPLKLTYKIEESWKKLKDKIEAFRVYIKNIPELNEKQILKMPPISVTAPYKAENDQISKIMTGMLQNHKKNLIELRNIRKIRKQIIDLVISQFDQNDNSF